MRLVRGLQFKCSPSRRKEADTTTSSYKLHRLDKGPFTKVKIKDSEGLKYYAQMQAIRQLERSAGSMYKTKSIRGFCHLYSGQEAVAVGIKAAMRPADTIITSYRAHGWAYLMGISLDAILCELTGRKKGCSRGKGGSMHMFGHNFYGGNGIVGAQVPMGAGIALAHSALGTGGVSITLFGDGAANQGQVFEAFNIAKLWNLPALFVVENNHYGMGTSASRSSASTAYYTRGDYIPGLSVDGMDVLAVREAFTFAIEYSSTGRGPIVLEAITYRYGGHSMSDPGTSYRSREEVEKVRKTKDPIATFREKLLSLGLATEDKLKEIDIQARKRMQAVEKTSVSAVEVPIEELWGDVYMRAIAPGVRGVAPWHKYTHKNYGQPMLKKLSSK